MDYKIYNMHPILKNGIFIIVFIFVQTLSAQHDKRTLRTHFKAINYSFDKKIVLVSLDTIYDSGSPYGIIKRSMQMRSDFDVNTLNGTPIFFITDDGAAANSLTMRFLDGSGRLATIPSVFGIERLADFLVKQQLLTAQGLNEGVLNIFLTKYPYRERRTIIETVVQDINNAIDNSGSNRNRNAQIYQRGNELVQNNFTIATFTQKNENFGTSVKNVIYIYYTDGTLCAKAIFKHGISDVSIITSKDNRNHDIVIKGHIGPVDIAKYLVQWLYL